MIVNSSKTTHIIVELTKNDIISLLEGDVIYSNSRAYNDEPALAQVYCSNPSMSIKRDCGCEMEVTRDSESE